MIIEQAKTEDFEQVWDLQTSIAPVGRTKEEAKTALQAMIDSEDCFLAVAREGEDILGTVTGVCCSIMLGSFLAIEDMVVREDCRGTGIGKQLMAAMDDFAVERGCLYAILVSSGFRKDAHAFYEKQGFVEQVRGFRKGYFEDE